MLQDRLLQSQEIVKELRMSLGKAQELHSEEAEDQEFVQVLLEQIEDLPVEESEEEEESEKISLWSWSKCAKDTCKIWVPART